MNFVKCFFRGAVAGILAFVFLALAYTYVRPIAYHYVWEPLVIQTIDAKNGDDSRQ